MKPSLPFMPCARRSAGSALIITLAFLVLATGLVLAFFLRAMSEHQVASSSASKAQVDLFTEGAVATVIGDIKQEIASGSTSPVTATGDTAPNTNVYYPKSAATTTPSLVGRPATATTLPNLLKRSAYNQPFFSGKDYDTTNYPPSNRAANVSTTSYSQNLRSWSPARWNSALLMPKQDPTSDTDFTPPSGDSGFTPPDWVLVARDGSNPTAWNSALSSKTSTSYVVGRYAYTIYDEGGLVDMNAAGYPTGTTQAQSGSKLSQAYADLTQFVDSNSQPLLLQNEIDALVGWRNYATGQPNAEFPTPNFDATAALNYFKGSATNGRGYLRTANTALFNNQSDRLFSNRQQLMTLLLSGIAAQTSSDTDKAQRARMQAALQYLGTFSRDINQPSYVPPTSRPLILPAAAGGNVATGLDNDYNPSFLTVRAKTAFTRNDGTTAVVGEPLVKKRFALSRLAWLTCKGPSGPRASSNDADIAALKKLGYTTEWLQQGTDANILKYFGLQWTTTSTAKMAANYWTYVHGRNGSTGAIMRLDSLSDSNDVVRAGREPDFFELLKAGINAGSLAKVGTSVPKSGKNIPNLNNQYYLDYSVDNAIIQIGANIIDQFDTDNFPTRIVFNDGVNPPTTFCGIENLPYLNRVLPAVVKVRAPKIASDTSGTGLDYYGTSDSLTGNQQVLDTGLGATFLIPELWNPHDWCGDGASQAQIDQTIGTMGPTDFEIYSSADTAVTVQPAHFYPPSTANGNTDFYNGGNATMNPGFPDRGFHWSSDPAQINESTTKMVFQIPTSTPSDLTGAQLFREPTVLYIKNKPTGSNLTAPGLTGISSPHTVALTNGQILAKVGDGGAYNAGSPQFPGPPIVGNSYIGMYLGTIPLIWRTGVAGTPPTTGPVWRANSVILDDQLGPGVLFTFNLQCKDAFGNLITYDQKQVSIGHSGEGWGRIARPMTDVWAGLLQPRRDGERVFFVLDPRTSRFGVQNTAPETGDNNTTQLQWSYPPFSYSHLTLNRAAGITPVEAAWLSRGEGIMGSIRNGWGNGAAVQEIDDNQPWRGGLNPFNFPNSMGFYPGSRGNNTVWTWNDAKNAVRPGLFAENDGAPLDNDQIAGDVQWYAGRSVGMPTTPQYYADPDGVVRRGMGGWTDSRISYIGPPTLAAFDTQYAMLTGLPMRVAHQLGSDNKLHKCDIKLNYPPTLPELQAEARPMILNRPFHSVAELGYTFAGTPWKNLNFNMPESGDTALLDIFCINDTDDPNGLVAGKVNLNTRQAPVLKAIISGAYKNEWPTSDAYTNAALADTQANRLVARTTGVVPAGTVVSGTGARPLQNIRELVGKWVSGQSPGMAPTAAANTPPYGPTSFDGYSVDLINPASFLDWSQRTPNTDAAVDPNYSYDSVLDKAVSRRRSAPIRALTSAGQARVWNLMIDVVTQTGRYSQSANSLDKFTVEGEQHCWVHVAIDRMTGEILDKQTETVNR